MKVIDLPAKMPRSFEEPTVIVNGKRRYFLPANVSLSEEFATSVRDWLKG